MFFCQALAIYSRIVQRDHAESAARWQAIPVSAPENDSFLPAPWHGPSENPDQQSQPRWDGDKPEDDGDISFGHAVQEHEYLPEALQQNSQANGVREDEGDELSLVLFFERFWHHNDPCFATSIPCFLKKGPSSFLFANSICSVGAQSPGP